MRFQICKQWWAITVVALFIGCSGSDQDEKQSNAVAAELQGAPPWVLKGCAAFDSESAPICGVGSGSGACNISVARSMAIGRAGTDLAWNLKRKLKVFLSRTYHTDCGGEDFFTAEVGGELVLVPINKRIIKALLPNVSVESSWMSKTGRLWMLVTVAPGVLLEIVSEMEMDCEEELHRDDLLNGIKRAFKKLDVTADFSLSDGRHGRTASAFCNLLELRRRQ